MSNKHIKLYTEEQVRKAIMIAENQKIGFTKIVREHLTPIKLPSDEEIEEYADSVMPYAEKIGGETYTAYRAIKLGAKWMRKIVQGGNNEQ